MGYSGSGAAGIFGFAIYYLLLIARHRDAGSRLNLPVLPKWSGLISVSVGYGGMIGVAFADLVIAYFLFPAGSSERLCGVIGRPQNVPDADAADHAAVFPAERPGKPERSVPSVAAAAAKRHSCGAYRYGGRIIYCLDRRKLHLQRRIWDQILPVGYSALPLLLSSVALSLVRTVVMYHIAKNQSPGRHTDTGIGCVLHLGVFLAAVAGWTGLPVRYFAGFCLHFISLWDRYR